MLTTGDEALDVHQPHHSSAPSLPPTPLDVDPMFLPEQTPSPSLSSSSSSTAKAPVLTPTPQPYVLQQQPAANERYPVAIPDSPSMHHNIEGEPFEDAEWAARRLRAHGKRRQRDDVDPLDRRGGCFNLDNSRLSCQPTSGQEVIQNSWFEFQWSTRNPLFNQVNDVHIYLFNGQTGDQVYFWEENKLQGSIQVATNDSFWPAAASNIQPGQNQTFPYYFVIIPSTAIVHNGETSEPTFTGIQTALPNSLLQRESSISRASTASIRSQSTLSTLSTASAASAMSSISILSTASTGVGGNPSHTAGGSLNPGGHGSSFPNWAIALIVVLAFFLLLAFLLGTYLVIRRARRRREEEERRHSMGSASPIINRDTKSPPHLPIADSMMAGHGGDEKAALLAGGALGASRLGGGPGSLTRGEAGMSGGTGGYDGASMMSGSDTTGPGMLSGADAAIVADAFRQAMRKPDFTGRPVEEDESPDQPDEEEENPTQLMSQELAKEGRNIRSVASARDVKVQGSTPPS